MFLVWHTAIIAFFVLLSFGLGYTLGLKQRKVHVKRK